MRQLKVGDLEKKSKLVFWLIIFAAVFAIFFAVNALDARTEIFLHPEMGCLDDLKYNSDRYCPLWSIQKSKVWKLYMPQVGLYNRFIHLSMTPKKRKIENDESGSEQKLSTTLKVRVYGSVKSEVPLMHWQEAVVFTCKQDVSICESLVLKSIKRLDPTLEGMRVELELQDANSLISHLLFVVKTGNPAFTRELIILKFSFFLLSVIVSGWCWRNKQKLSSLQPQNEHRGLSVSKMLELVFKLTLAQVCINEPLYFLALTNPGPFSTTLTALSESGYYAYLLYYWLVNFGATPTQIHTLNITQYIDYILKIYYILNIYSIYTEYSLLPRVRVCLHPPVDSLFRFTHCECIPCLLSCSTSRVSPNQIPLILHKAPPGSPAGRVVWPPSFSSS